MKPCLTPIFLQSQKCFSNNPHESHCLANPSPWPPQVSGWNWSCTSVIETIESWSWGLVDPSDRFVFLGAKRVGAKIFVMDGFEEIFVPKAGRNKFRFVHPFLCHKWNWKAKRTLGSGEGTEMFWMGKLEKVLKSFPKWNKGWKRFKPVLTRKSNTWHEHF